MVGLARSGPECADAKEYMTFVVDTNASVELGELSETEATGAKLQFYKRCIAHEKQ